MNEIWAVVRKKDNLCVFMEFCTDHSPKQPTETFNFYLVGITKEPCFACNFVSAVGGDKQAEKGLLEAARRD